MFNAFQIGEYEKFTHLCFFLQFYDLIFKTSLKKP